MLGVTFGSKHSYNDWGIWLEDTHINPPLPKRYIVDVPARNGLLDLTPELTPTIRFENRTLTFNFRVKAGDWSTLVSQIYGDIHGRTLDVVSDLDPNWHWHGCVTVDDFSSDERTGKLVITVDADPFKLSNTENSYTVNGDGTITCEVDRMEISPAFEIEAPTTVIYGDSSYTIESTATTEKTLSGDIVSFADGTANPAVDLTLDIDATQDLHGYDYPWVGGAGKNLIPLRSEEWTTNTVSYTPQSDGTLKINGTDSSSSAHLEPVTPFISLPAGTYIFSYSGMSAARVCDSSDNNIVSTNEGTFTLSATTSVRVLVTITNGTAISNAIFKTMIRKSTESSDWQPYSNICPISGWDEVNVNVAGKNLAVEFGNYYPDASGIIQSSSLYLSYVVPVQNGEKYTFSRNGVKVTIPVIAYYKDYPRLGSTSYNGSRQISVDGTFTSPVNGYAIIRMQSTDTHDVQVEVGTTASSFEPNGNTTTVDLGQTVYGGTLDVTTGVLTVTHGIKEFDGTESFTLVSDGTASRRFVVTLRGTSANGICSHGIMSNSNTGTWGEFRLYSSGNFAVLDGNSYFADETSLKSYLTAQNTGGTPLTVCYELATPQLVQLTAEQVMILKNQNNIWADSGEVEVTYIAQDYAGKKFYIPDLELTEGSNTLTIQGTGTTKVTYTNGRL